MSVLGESLSASAAGAVLGSAFGWYYGYPKIGAVTGAALGGVAGVAYGTAKAAAENVLGEVGEVVGFLPSYGQLIGGPGAMTPQRMFLAQQFAPDRYGWAMSPAGMQSAYGPALARAGGDHGPAYLRMPYNSALPGSSTPPPSTYFQQDVAPRAAEAAGELLRRLESAGHSGEVTQLLNAYGVRFSGGPEILDATRKVGATIAKGANLAAVLIRRSEKSYGLYFTDYPSMLMEASDGEAERVASLSPDGSETEVKAGWLQGAGVHYGTALVSGAAAGATLAIARPSDIPMLPSAAAGAGMGLGVAYLTRARQLPAPPNELPTERIGREAVQKSMAAQTGRWLNLLVWGPGMIAAGYMQPNAVGSVLSTTSGAVLMGTSALDLYAAYRLKVRHDDAFRSRIANYAVSRPRRTETARTVARVRGKIEALKRSV